MDEWMKGWIGGGSYRGMDVQMVRRMKGWMDGWRKE